MNRSFEPLQVVALTRDLPEHSLKAGQRGTVVHVFGSPADAYEVEFVDSDGRTLAQVPLAPDQLVAVDAGPPFHRLKEALRGSTVQLTDVNIQDEWLEIVRPLLPESPLTAAFLDEVLQSLPKGLPRSGVLHLLARLGRTEVAETAAALAEGETDGDVLLELAEALLSCRDKRGCELIRRLYLENRGKFEGPGWVPTGWLIDALWERRDWPEAEKLQAEISRMEQERTGQ